MINMTSPRMLAVRRLSRRLGLNGVAGKILGAGGYESKLSGKMLSSIAVGDCVWDVGANVGYYTTRFSDLVGAPGKVLAFEPSPRNREKLEAATSGKQNVTVLSSGLSDVGGEAVLLQGLDDIGATSRIVSDTSGSDAGHRVRLARGDDLVASGEAARPNVLKIDVEGFELEVVRGLEETLESPAVRHLFLEIHFSLLEERGLPQAPAAIEALLAGKGFHLTWMDPSHLHAYRDPERTGVEG